MASHAIQSAADVGQEVWAPVPGYEGVYEASTLGNVRSIDRVIDRPNRWGGTSKDSLKGKILRQNKNNSGYFQVVLCVNGKPKNTFVHRIIAETFIGPIDAGLDVCHADGSRENNILSNLRIDTRASNMADCKKHGTSPVGARNGMVKLSEEQVRAIRAANVDEMPIRMEYAREYGVRPHHIIAVKKGRFWGHLV